MTACRNGNATIVSELLSLDNIDVNAVDNASN